MKVARESRGYDARWLWQAKGFAASAGALFIRSYERGERVHLAMISRGFDGRLPEVDDGRAGTAQWAAAMSLPAVATLICVLGLGGPAVSHAPALEVSRLAFAYPGRHTRRCSGSTSRSGSASASRCSGPNGAGKTTLVMHLNGINTAQHGSVLVGGLPVTKEHMKEIRRRVGIVFQDPDDQLFMPTVRARRGVRARQHGRAR